ncbi:MAG TPA: hypothetical protein VF190_03085, partial [Rhodothermales bacterium]
MSVRYTSILLALACVASPVFHTSVIAQTTSGAALAASDYPMLAPWTGPNGGVPAFDRVQVEHFEPAIERAMAEYLAEIDAITSNPEPPTFENTIAAFE